jgi:periplasmic protein TonB
MFSGLSVAQEHAARRWTALTSFTLQAALVAAALIFPMIHPQTLPQALLNRRLFVPTSNGEVRIPSSQSGAQSHGPVVQPIVVSNNFSFHRVNYRPLGIGQPVAPDIGEVVDIGDPSSVLKTIAGTNLIPVLRPPAPVHTIRQSVVMEGNLVHRVEPQYPMIAKQLHIQGVVILKAVISREGRIEQAETVQGQDLLSRAALEAVRQWKYRPYDLNGEPVEVETQITVNFVLDR